MYDDIHFLDLNIENAPPVGTPIAFLDRDGVINLDSGYVFHWEDFIILDGVIEALTILQKKYCIVICTNQSGISRGFYEINDFVNLMKKFNDFVVEHNIFIRRAYFCPHHPDGVSAPYNLYCTCRKPMPGMIAHGLKSFQPLEGTSIMIGDKDSDVEAGNSIGISQNFLINNGYAGSSSKLHFKSLLEVAKFLNL